MATRILLLGKSVFIAGLEASLKGRPDLAVSRCEQLQEGTLLQADLILADLAEEKDLRRLIQMSDEAERTLVGIDPATGKATVLSGQSAAMKSVQELMTFLQNVESKHFDQRRPTGETEHAPIL
jgi:hypothetical protein